MKSKIILLQTTRTNTVLLQSTSHPGALILLDGTDRIQIDIQLAAHLAAYFSKGRDAEKVYVAIKKALGGRRNHNNNTNDLRGDFTIYKINFITYKNAKYLGVTI